MKSVTEIKSAIINGQFSNDELMSIVEAVKYARGQLGRDIKRSLQVGDNVNFTNSRNGKNYTGHVVKVAIKNVTVRTTEGLWRVPASMLSLVDA